MFPTATYNDWIRLSCHPAGARSRFPLGALNTVGGQSWFPGGHSGLSPYLHVTLSSCSRARPAA